MKIMRLIFLVFLMKPESHALGLFGSFVQTASNLVQSTADVVGTVLNVFSPETSSQTNNNAQSAPPQIIADVRLLPNNTTISLSPLIPTITNPLPILLRAISLPINITLSATNPVTLSASVDLSIPLTLMFRSQDGSQQLASLVLVVNLPTPTFTYNATTPSNNFNTSLPLNITISPINLLNVSALPVTITITCANTTTSATLTVNALQSIIFVTSLLGPVTVTVSGTSNNGTNTTTPPPQTCGVQVGILCSINVIKEKSVDISSLPSELITEVRDIVQYGVLKILSPETACPPVNNTDNITFSLYNRQNPKNPIKIDCNTILIWSQKNKITILVHDVMETGTSAGVMKLKDEYIANSDYNVIVMDWSPLSNTTFAKARCNVKQAAQKLASFLCCLYRNNLIDLRYVHLVGKGMGAHVAGIAGSLVQEQCSTTAGKITGLDPFGPLFQNCPKSERLHPGCAYNVQVILTSQLTFGYIGDALGHVNFFVNGGFVQPCCMTLSLPCVVTSTVSAVMCNSIISWYYMALSINNTIPNGIPCMYVMAGVCVPFGLNSKVVMGQNTPEGTKGNYLVSML